jgi:diaminopimelate decarboxylase
MRPFSYRRNQLFCEDVSLASITKEWDTPIYVYSQADLMRRLKVFKNATLPEKGSHQVLYALKANSNPTILKLFSQAGIGAEVNSGGELFLACNAGFIPGRIVFSGVGKTKEELHYALSLGIKAFHVESRMELEALGRIATDIRTIAPVTVRLNPDVSAPTHPHISTGRKIHKFGVDTVKAIDLMHLANEHPWMKPVGLSAHIGSQIAELEPFVAAAVKLSEVAVQIADQGIKLEYLDVGGGLGILDDELSGPTASDWISAVAKPIQAQGYRLIVEPGRSLVGPSGALITRIVYTKYQGDQRFLVVDAGMNDLIRPALYGARHPILPLRRDSGSPESSDSSAVVVGPVCETSDTFDDNIQLPPLASGDQLAFMQTGAYGFAMSSNYNGRLKPAEVLVNGDKFRLIRRRQTYQDLLSQCD